MIADHPVSLLDVSVQLADALGAIEPSRLDFLADRINREARTAAGIEPSKRQYNRRFRVVQRVAAKARKLEVEQTKPRLTMVARSGFAATIDRDARRFVSGQGDDAHRLDRTMIPADVVERAATAGWTEHTLMRQHDRTFIEAPW